jgi:putative Mn2+ efflux pump MntP
MMMNLGLVYGLDNAAVAFALAPTLGWRKGLMLAAMFGAAEALMPLAGATLALPTFGFAEAMRAGLLALTATTIAGLVMARRDPAAVLGSLWAMAVFAVIMGLDNLVAGAGLASSGAPVATIVMVGLGSAAVSAAACLIGAGLTHRLKARRAAMVSSAALIAVAAAGLLG